jgi:predicted cupin superfamily sugar epimerase
MTADQLIHALELAPHLEGDAASPRTVRLGGRVTIGEEPQLVVQKGHRQAAEAVQG